MLKATAVMLEKVERKQKWKGLPAIPATAPSHTSQHLHSNSPHFFEEWAKCLR